MATLEELAARVVKAHPAIRRRVEVNMPEAAEAREALHRAWEAIIAEPDNLSGIVADIEFAERVAQKNPDKCSKDFGPCAARIESMRNHFWDIEILDKDKWDLRLRGFDQPGGYVEFSMPIRFCPLCGERL